MNTQQHSEQELASKTAIRSDQSANNHISTSGAEAQISHPHTKNSKPHQLNPQSGASSARHHSRPSLNQHNARIQGTKKISQVYRQKKRTANNNAVVQDQEKDHAVGTPLISAELDANHAQGVTEIAKHDLIEGKEKAEVSLQSSQADQQDAQLSHHDFRQGGRGNQAKRQPQRRPVTAKNYTQTKTAQQRVKENPNQSKHTAKWNQQKNSHHQRVQQKQFQGNEDDGGYDANGFYIYTDGSFLDPDGYYFDKWGFDELGGHYDDDNIYHPLLERAQSKPIRSEARPDRHLYNKQQENEQGYPHYGDYAAYRAANQVSQQRVAPRGQQRMAKQSLSYAHQYHDRPLSARYHHESEEYFDTRNDIYYREHDEAYETYHDQHYESYQDYGAEVDHYNPYDAVHEDAKATHTRHNQKRQRPEPNQRKQMRGGLKRGFEIHHQQAPPYRRYATSYEEYTQRQQQNAALAASKKQQNSRPSPNKGQNLQAREPPKKVREPRTASDLVRLAQKGSQDVNSQSAGSSSKRHHAQEGAAAFDKAGLEPTEFVIYERGVDQQADQGGPTTGHTRGAYRGGRGGGKPTPKPQFAQYSSESGNKEYQGDGGHSRHASEDIIPFSISSPDILRVKGERQAKQKQASAMAGRDSIRELDAEHQEDSNGLSHQTHSNNVQQMHKQDQVRSDEAEIREVQTAIINMKKNIEQQVPSSIDPAVHLQYQQIMSLQLQEKLKQINLQAGGEPCSGENSSSVKEGDHRQETSESQNQKLSAQQQSILLQQQALELQRKLLLAQTQSSQQAQNHQQVMEQNNFIPVENPFVYPNPMSFGTQAYHHQQHMTQAPLGAPGAQTHHSAYQVFQTTTYLGQPSPQSSSFSPFLSKEHFLEEQRGIDSFNIAQHHQPPQQQDFDVGAEEQQFRLKQSEISAMLSDQEDEQSLFISERSKRSSRLPFAPPQLSKGVSEYTPHTQNPLALQTQQMSQKSLNTNAIPFEPNKIASENQLQVIESSFSAPGGFTNQPNWYDQECVMPGQEMMGAGQGEIYYDEDDLGFDEDDEAYFDQEQY